MYLNADEVEVELLCHSSCQQRLASAWSAVEQHTTPLLDGALAEQGRELEGEGGGEGGGGEGGGKGFEHHFLYMYRLWLFPTMFARVIYRSDFTQY